MIKYLRYSDLAIRLNLNPFNWNWVPGFEHDRPTLYSPNRNTFVVAWLFLQIFIDFDNGVTDIKAYTEAVMGYANNFETQDVYDEEELDRKMDNKVSKSSPRGFNLE